MKKNNIPYILSILICVILFIGSILYYQSHTHTKQDNYSITLTNIGFDTPITFSCTCSQSEFDSYVKIISDKYTYYNDLFDPYHAYDMNNVYTLNQSAYDHPIEVDKDLIDCLHISKDIYNQSPYFDITQGKLLSIWHQYRMDGIQLNANQKDGTLPSITELQEALNINSWENIEINDNTISFKEDMQIDLGGIAKGYATEKVKQELIKNGCDNGFINAGGNVVLINKKKDGSDWKIGIQSPDENALNAYIQFNKPTSIVTSGDYERFYTVNQTRYAHIIDPFTLFPSTKNRSVTIICDDSIYADAYSTTLFCMDVEEGFKFIEKNHLNLEAIWIVDKSCCSLQPTYQTKQYDIYATKGIQSNFIIKE